MNKKYIIFYILLLLTKKTFGISRGQDSSLLYLSTSNIFNYDEITNLIIFGDSHSATKTNQTTMEQIPCKRRNWPLPLSDIHNMKLWNFAATGAVVDFNITYREGYEIDFLKQYELFNEKMTKDKIFYNQWDSKNTLFALYLGSNDIHFINFINTNKTVFQVMDNIIDIIFNHAEKMYEKGARNFIFINVPPLNEAPINAKGKHSYYKDEIPYFNNAINKKTKILFKKYNDINIIVYNLNNEYMYIMENYKEFGFLFGKEAWLNNPEFKEDDYFWRNPTHISNKGNKLIAEDINDLLTSLNEKYEN